MYMKILFLKNQEKKGMFVKITPNMYSVLVDTKYDWNIIDRKWAAGGAEMANNNVLNKNEFKSVPFHSIM